MSFSSMDTHWCSSVSPALHICSHTVSVLRPVRVTVCWSFSTASDIQTESCCGLYSNLSSAVWGSDGGTCRTTKFPLSFSMTGQRGCDGELKKQTALSWPHRKTQKTKSTFHLLRKAWIKYLHISTVWVFWNKLFIQTHAFQILKQIQQVRQD